MLRTLLICVGLCLAALPARATEFYVDPNNGRPSGNGSASHPWQSIQEVFDAGRVESQQWDKLPYTEDSKLVVKNPGAPVRAGDTIWLRSGYYGDLAIERYYNSETITLAAQKGHAPRLSSLRVHSGSNWTIRGLTISTGFGPTYNRRTLVSLNSNKWHGPIYDVALQDCMIYSVADSSSWTAEDWDQKACNGIEVGGTRMTICNNHLRNVNFGISGGTTHSLISDNIVENFSGDGLRGLGNHTTFQYNVVKNCYNVNRNHDDGFQSWSRGPDGVGKGEVVGVTLRGNTFLNYEDPNQPYRGTLQGIGCFDGTYVDWVIENNVVITDHWHGITLLGARNCRVINNTVVDRNSTAPGPPSIRIGNHKNGTRPVNCVMRNNMTTGLSRGPGVLDERNMIVRGPLAIFVDIEHFDLHLKATARAIDAGSRVEAPKLDRDRIPRPQGDGIDIGAYEWHTDDVKPVEEDHNNR